MSTPSRTSSVQRTAAAPVRTVAAYAAGGKASITNFIMALREARAEPVAAIATGSPSLDRALGYGVYPRGRVIEIYGPESSGQTTLTLHAIAECQCGGGVAACIVAEHARRAERACPTPHSLG